MILQCPQCNTENAPDAKFCKNCGVAFAVAPIKKKNNLPLVVAIIGGLLILCVICGKMSDSVKNTPTNSDATTPIISEPSLKLLSMNEVASSELYFRVIGEIQNDSNQKIQGLSVIVTTYDKSGQIVGNESGIVDYDPLMPNQISPFTVVIRSNPTINSYKIAFKQGFGKQIDFTDARVDNKPRPKKKK